MWPRKQQQLGRGAYGTVRKNPFDPSRVIKTLHARPTQDEIAAFNRKRDFLRAVDPNQEYFIIGDIDYDSGTISMKNGGKSLHRISPKELPDMYNAVPRLLDALCILQNHGVVHGDIKAANIVFDGERLRIIDFDLMGTFEEYRKDFQKKRNFPGIERSTYYSVWPPQRFLGNEWFEFATNPNDTSFHLNKDATGLLESILRRQKTLLSEPYIEVFEDMTRQPRTREAFNKIDVYGLGLVLNDLFIRNADSPFRNDAGLRKLVFFMTHPDPRRRLDACRAREEWKNTAGDAMDVQPPARDKRPRRQQQQQQSQRRARPRPPPPRQQKVAAAFPPGGA
jgi:serine/threonine protein kinase